MNDNQKQKRRYSKRMFIIAVALLGSFATIAVAVTLLTGSTLPLRNTMVDAPLTPHQRKLLARDQLAEPGALVLLGDSHLEFMANEQWWPGTLNLGSGGDTSTAVLDRMDSYQSLNSAGVVVISLGANDIARGYSINRTLANLKEIVSRLPKQTPVVLTTIHAMDEHKGWVGYNRNIRRLNHAYQEAFAASDQVQVVESPHAPTHDDDNLAEAMHNGDGIHLSKAGYEAWLAVLKPAVDSLLKKRLSQ